MAKVNSYYGSYYTAFPALSYATNTCSDAGNGLVRYPIAGIKYGTGKTCDEARQAYQRAFGKGTTGQTAADRSGLNTPKGQGTISNLKTQTDEFNRERDASGLLKTPGLPSLPDGTTNPNDVNPASGCHNCGPDWWNPRQWGCVLFAKPSCELQVAWNNGWNGIVKFMGDNAIWIAGVGIVSIVVLMALLRR